MPALTRFAVMFVLLQLAGCSSVHIVEHVPRDVASFPERPAEPSASRQHGVPSQQRVQVPEVRVPHIPHPAVSEKTPAGPRAPAPVITCDPAGCWSDGQRYEGGPGGTFIDKSGRMCQRNGTWMQCF